ncbi:UbiD family decarboxylase [archaeon]|nr:UbiD family decarboxylase [archaeon]
MNLKQFLTELEKKELLLKINQKVNPEYEIAAIQNQLKEKTVLYENVQNSGYQVVSGICSTRQHFAIALGIKKNELIETMTHAMNNPTQPELTKNAPCQEVFEEANLDTIPILTHFKTDGGPYITSAVAIIKDPDYGRNACYHRLMKIDKNSFTARIIEQRGTDTAMKKAFAQNKELEIAFCIGPPIQVLLAAAMSPGKSVDELSIANTMQETPLVKCKTIDLEVPAETEIILEGKITKKQGHEGPFVDLTNTIDFVRQQPHIEINCMTHKHDPIYHALLPAGPEHKNLMGMPREPTIYTEVKKVCKCRNVLITPGGCSWLHAIIQINKKQEEDSKKAIQAAFNGHTSLKHCVIIDEDIDIYNPADIEWAIATRFQADKDMIILENQPSSSLDPSAEKPEGQKARTAKLGIDATMPIKNRNKFRKKEYEQIYLPKYMRHEK